MKAITLVMLAVAMVIGVVAADYGYGGYSYVPAYGAGGAGGYPQDNTVFIFGFMFIILLLLTQINRGGVSNFTING